MYTNATNYLLLNYFFFIRSSVTLLQLGCFRKDMDGFTNPRSALGENILVGYEHT